MTYDYDFFVIGGGSGGVRAARIAGQHGAKVGLAEDALLGGTCVNVGCVPKKLLVMASHVHDEIEDAAGFGWTIEHARFDWPTLIANKDRELLRLRGFYRQGLERAGVTILEARAKLLSDHEIDVGGKRVSAKYILIATGAYAQKPDVPGAELTITSDDAFALPTLPKRIAIYGAGYIGIEFAGVFRGLGSEVTVIHRRDQILRGFDPDVREALAAAMINRGIRIEANAPVKSVMRAPDGFHIALDREGSVDAPDVVADLVLFATGRVPNTKQLGLEAAGVTLGDKGKVVVDEYSRSSTPNIYAVGDCTDRITLTPVAIAEGHAVADTLFGPLPRKFEHDLVASAVFSQPTVATIGLTEEAARERFDDVHVYQTRVRPMKDTLGGREERALFKLVVDGESDRVVGCHIVGPAAEEIIQGFAVAMRCGVTKQQIDSTVGIHPSLAEDLLTIRTRTR